MKLDAKDVEAVAKSRISRAEGNRMTYWMVGVVATIVGGAFVLRYSVMAGWILCIVGLVGFFVYQNNLSKKQNVYKRELLEEWEKEQEQETK